MVKAPSLSLKVAKKRRRVSFAKGSNESEVGFQVKWIPSNVSAQDKQRMHCTKKEKKNMRKMAREVADEVYTHDKPHRATIMDCPPPNAIAYTPVMLRAFESCRHSNPLNQKELHRLIHWVATGHSRRGLEKLSVNGLSENMGNYRRKAIQTVIEMHATAMANHGYLSRATQDSISNTYRKFSDPSKKFAALMGYADAEAVQLERREHHRPSSPTSVIVDPMSDCQVESFELSDPIISPC